MKRVLHMVRLGFAITVAAAPSIAQTDAAIVEQVFLRYDRDGNGSVTRREFPGSDAQFAELDADADGSVDRAEFERSTLAKRLLVARRKDAEDSRPRVELDAIALRRLEAALRFDVNRDGRVAREEWNGPPSAFDEIDLDRDGDLDQFDRSIAKRFAPDDVREPTLPELTQRLDSIDQLTRKLDTNQDGQLSRRELARHRLAEAFDWADRNGDDALDVDELRRLARVVNERIASRDQGRVRMRAFRVPFATWDKNDDGRLEPDEWAERKYLFARIDQDRDAAVTKDEVARYERSVEGRTFVERFDLDGDGRVTPAEFGGPPGGFRRADQNGDGTVSRADR